VDIVAVQMTTVNIWAFWHSDSDATCGLVQSEHSCCISFIAKEEGRVVLSSMQQQQHSQTGDATNKKTSQRNWKCMACTNIVFEHQCLLTSFSIICNLPAAGTSFSASSDDEHMMFAD